MSDPAIPEQLRQGLSKRLVEWTLGLLTLTATALLQAFGDRTFDAVHQALGGRLLLQIGSLLLISSFYCVVLAVRSRNKKGVLARLKVVKGKGYSIDALIGEPVCPRCTTDEQAFPMREHGNNLLCWACMKGIIK